MSNEYLGAIIASDIGDVCDGLFAGVNREFADIFGAIPSGRSGGPSDLSRCASQPKAPAAIAKENDDGR